MAPFAPSTSSSATQGDAFEQLQGKRILQLNNYFIFDYADKLKLAHQAVDSQFCECGTSPLPARPCRRPARAQKHVAPLERERWLERLAAQVRSKPWRYCGRYAERLRRERTHTHQAAAGCHAPVPWCARKRARCPFMLRAAAAACCCCVLLQQPVRESERVGMRQRGRPSVGAATAHKDAFVRLPCCRQADHLRVGADGLLQGAARRREVRRRCGFKDPGLIA